MHQYYVNLSPQENGDYEVHKENCVNLPSSRDYVGYFQTCDEAVKEAQKNYAKTNGCRLCSSECHTDW